MKAWIQRVSDASVTIDGEVVAAIGKGYLVLLNDGPCSFELVEPVA